MPKRANPFCCLHIHGSKIPATKGCGHRYSIKLKEFHPRSAALGLLEQARRRLHGGKLQVASRLIDLRHPVSARFNALSGNRDNVKIMDYDRMH